MSACDRGHIEVVKALLAKGASVTTINNDVSTQQSTTPHLKSVLRVNKANLGNLLCAIVT